MTPRSRLPESWGSSPPDRLAGCMIACIKMVVIIFFVTMIGSLVIGSLQEWLNK